MQDENTEKNMFKIREGFTLTRAAGVYLIVPLGAYAETYRQVMTLNETGAFLWKALEKGCDKETLAGEMAEHFAVPRQEAAEDLEIYLTHLDSLGVLQEGEEICGKRTNS